MTTRGSPAPELGALAAEAGASPRFEELARTSARGAELDLDLVRARLLSRFGAPVWASFALYDVLQASRPEVGHLAELLALRAAGALGLLALAFWGKRRPSTSRAQVELSMTVSGMLLSLCVSFMALYDGGFTSVYSPGVVLVMFAMASVPRPLRRGLRINTLVLLPYPIVMCTAALVSPRHAAQLRDPSVIAAGVQFHFAALATAAFIAVLGNTLWSLRRELLTERSLASYQLTRLLGQGPLGEVWLGRQRGLRRDVAIKVLHKQAVIELGGAQAVEQAVQASAALCHANTVRLYHFALNEAGRPYYVMELLEGDTLGRLIERDGKLSVERATRIMLQIARSLAEAHARGFSHRNLKPENVLISQVGDQSDFVKVLDYGLSTHVTRAALGMSGTGSADEQAAHLADVYALGALFYLALTGEAVASAAPVDTASALERHPSPSVRRKEPLPDRIESVVLRCLESDASERFANARQVGQALVACIMQLEAAAGMHAETGGGTSRARELRSERAATDSEQTRIEDPLELERLLGASARGSEDNETVVSR